MEIEGGEKHFGVFNQEVEKDVLGALQQLAHEEVIYQIDVSLNLGTACTHSLILTSKHLFLKSKHMENNIKKSSQVILCVQLSFSLKF